MQIPRGLAARLLAFPRVAILSLRFVASSLVIGVPLACGGSAPPPPAVPEPQACEEPQLGLEVLAGARLNASPGTGAMPVQLRLYQLSSEAALSRATFEELWQDDAQVLGDTLLGRRELTVYPEARESLDWPVGPEARALAAVAIFRQPRGRDWTKSFVLDTSPADGRCAPARLDIRLWLNEMQLRDGSGRPEATP